MVYVDPDHAGLTHTNPGGEVHSAQSGDMRAIVAECARLTAEEVSA